MLVSAIGLSGAFIVLLMLATLTSDLLLSTRCGPIVLLLISLRG